MGNGTNYEVTIKTLADVQGVRRVQTEFVKLEADTKELGLSTKDVSAQLAKLDAVMDSDQAVAIRMAEGFDLAAKAQARLGNAAEAARLRSRADTMVADAGLDPKTAFKGEQDFAREEREAQRRQAQADKIERKRLDREEREAQRRQAQVDKIERKRLDREMARADAAEKARRKALQKELAQKQKETADRQRDENREEPKRSGFSLGGLVARAFGFGVGASFGAEMAHRLVRDFTASLREAFSKEGGITAAMDTVKSSWGELMSTIGRGAAATGVFQRVAMVASTTLISWKMALDQLAPGQAAFAELQQKNEAETAKFVSTLEKARLKQADYDKQVASTNIRLKAQLDGLMAVKKASDSVDDAKAEYDKAVINERERRGQMPKEDADKARAAIDMQASARRYKGDHAAKETEKEAAQRALNTAHADVEDKKKRLAAIQAQEAEFGRQVDADKEKARQAAEEEQRSIDKTAERNVAKERGDLPQSARVDKYREFDAWDRAQIDQRTETFLDKQKTANYGATRADALKTQQDLEAAKKREAEAAAKFGSTNVELGGMEQVRNRTVATQRVPAMTDAQLEAAGREIMRATEGLRRLTPTLNKFGNALDDANKRNADRRAF